MAVTIILAALIVSGFLAGIRLMQSPRTALWGNRLGALSMLVAITWTALTAGEDSSHIAMLYVVIGAIAGLILGQSVKMIHMPQTVALLNGLGGAASALVVWAAVLTLTGNGAGMLFWGTSSLALGVGALTFSGSIIAVLKLQGIAFRRPAHLPGHGHILRISILLAALFIILNMSYSGLYFGQFMLLIALLGLMAGFFMTLRIGGADMPIVISLLNSFSGIAAAIAGLAVENIILAGTGALVGVAGMILTRIMCRAMNRSLFSVLAGFTAGSTKEASQQDVEASKEGTFTEEKPVAEEDPAPDTGREEFKGREEIKAPVEDKASSTGLETPGPAGEKDSEDLLPELLKSASRVIIVPGYGMAVAQAQNAVRQLVDALEQQGKEVKFAIHPVAGRMPGHMNVLLAEAGIDYEKLMDLDAINPQFPQADLVIVVGACDVINPAANAAEGTPISGMPILNAEQAKNVIVCNLDEKPGYSGVDNTLYDQPHVITLWGDAADTVPRLTAMLENGS